MNKKKGIRIFATGGTLDCDQYDEKSDVYTFVDTHIPEIITKISDVPKVQVETLMMKDSLLMNDADRQIILNACKKSREEKVVIVHGTATMVETAHILGKEIKNKTIVLTGAFTPYVEEETEAVANVGGALSKIQMLPLGVYIYMNEQIFNWDNVKKNQEKRIFEILS